MPALKNPRHEKFAQGLMQGMTSDAAYAFAGYSANRGNATRMKANESICERVCELTEEVAEKAVVDQAWVLERLMRNARIALAEEKVQLTLRPNGAKESIDVEVNEHNAPAANRALELLGKHLGMFKEVHEHSGPDGKPLLTQDPPDTRDLARAVIAVLQTAELDENETTNSALPGSTRAAALQGETAGVLSGSSVASPAPIEQPRPSLLRTGEREIRDNGAEITFDDDLDRYAVCDWSGKTRGWRSSLNEAINFADSLGAEPPERTKASEPPRKVGGYEEDPIERVNRQIRNAQAAERQERRVRKIRSRR